MISKLEYFADNGETDISEGRYQIDIVELVKFFRDQGRSVSVSPSQGGTLGLLFKLIEDNQFRFLKTHLPSKRCKENLIKEIDLLTFFYKDYMYIESLQVEDKSGPRHILVLDELSYPEHELDFNQILSLVSNYSDKLKYYRNDNLIQKNYSFEQLVNDGGKAVASLINMGLISQSVQQRVCFYISLIKRNLSSLTPCICHGDLGPKNIMVSGANFVVLDWEDAFWGIEGYDYLYWLTFFNNRKYYSQDIFGNTPWGKGMEIAIMILIIVLKSQLSVMSNNFQSNSMSFDQRIYEILALE